MDITESGSAKPITAFLLSDSSQEIIRLFDCSGRRKGKPLERSVGEAVAKEFAAKRDKKTIKPKVRKTTA